MANSSSESGAPRPAFDLSAFGEFGKLFQQFQPPGFDMTKLAEQFSLPTADFSKLTEQFQKLQVPGVDMTAVLEWQRKDMEVIGEANRQAYEGAMKLMARRAEILQHTFTQWQAALQGAFNPGAQANLAETARQGLQQAIADFQELVSLEAEARAKTWQIVQERLQENFANLQKLIPLK
jgi:hypothetical protein